MRILHVAEVYSPASGGVSGIMRVLSEGLVQLGHEVTVATGYHPMRDSNSLNGVLIMDFDLTGKVDLGYKGEIEQYQSFILNFQCDVIMIYAAQTWAADLIFPLLPKLKCKKVFIPCGFSSLNNPDYWEYYKKMPNVLNNFDQIVYFDEFSRDYKFGQKHGIKHFSIIPECADYGEHTATALSFRQKYKIKTRHILLNVASYGRNKAQHLLIETFYRLNYPDTTLVCIGPKPTDKKAKIYYILFWILAFIVQFKKGLGKIRLLKGVEKKFVVCAYHESDLFLLSSTFEVGTPLVIYETMAAGLPFISTLCGSLEELNYSGGIIVSDPYEMARAIEFLLSNENIRIELAENGKREYQKIHTIDNYINRFNELYQRLVL